MLRNLASKAALIAGIVISTQAMAVTIVPGLKAGSMSGNTNEFESNSGNLGVHLGVDLGQTDGKPPWADDTTYVYTGQVFDADGTFSFAENIDDNVRIRINGVEVLRNNAWDQPTTTGSATNNSAPGAGTLNFGTGPAGDGWHDIEIRMSNGGGGAGAVPGNGWTNVFGFGFNSNGSTSNQGTDYLIPVDFGDASFFRVPVASAGTPGLVEGFLVGDINTGPNPNLNMPMASQIKLSPELGYTNASPPWAGNMTVVYTGQFFDADGVFSFAENIDDKVRLFIDGQLALSNDAWDQPSSTGSATNNSAPLAGLLDWGMGVLGDGWHDIEIYMSNGGGGAGAVGGNGWTSSFGFGYNPNGSTSLNGADYIPLVDDGRGLLLRISTPIIPEPTSATLGLLAVASLAIRRRRMA